LTYELVVHGNVCFTCIESSYTPPFPFVLQRGIKGCK